MQNGVIQSILEIFPEIRISNGIFEILLKACPPQIDAYTNCKYKSDVTKVYFIFS